MTLRALFFDKVDPNGPVHPVLLTACHVWTGGRMPAPFDYGSIYTGHRDGWKQTARTHRVAWFLATGEIPAMQVLHRCDNPPCVNVDHLFLGTHDDNMEDKRAKGRAVHRDRSNLGPKVPATGDRHGTHLYPELYRGERNGSARLTEADVIAIREAADVLYRDLAARYGITATAVGYIRRGETWQHVGGPREGSCDMPRPTKPRLTPAETFAAVLDLLPPEDRCGTRRNPERPYRWQALVRLAARLGVTPGMVHLTMREGATMDLMAHWRTTLGES